MTSLFDVINQALEPRHSIIGSVRSSAFLQNEACQQTMSEVKHNLTKGSDTHWCKVTVESGQAQGATMQWLRLCVAPQGNANKNPASALQLKEINS
jgi:hypothetical protein